MQELRSIITNIPVVQEDPIEGLPPHIYEQPGKDVYFEPNFSVNLPCQATGHPTRESRTKDIRNQDKTGNKQTPPTHGKKLTPNKE
ncbi:hypothetical protein FSP39_007711 [Pinctada imbricata]|uniref:Uncharacterized protein n=1 Tax=Pinctada imbricata TaxID=66713 RepID=A0AA88YM02_PINIB|nr:hypothetical protein FSP39_007711 [Pinctada imbricata]